MIHQFTMSKFYFYYVDGTATHSLVFYCMRHQNL